MSAEERTFEQAQAELEQIVERLEKGQDSLDEAPALWEKGEQLYAFCRERLDSALMKTAPGRVVSKSGMEALRGVGILRGRRNGTSDMAASGFALKMEDGDGYERGTYAATVEALRQVGLLDESAVRQLGRYHRTPSYDPHGNLAAEAIPEFELVPVGELVG